MLLQNWSRSLVTLESAGEEPPLHTEEVCTLQCEEMTNVNESVTILIRILL